MKNTSKFEALKGQELKNKEELTGGTPPDRPKRPMGGRPPFNKAK